MGKHNDQEFEEKIKQGIHNSLEKQFRNGLAQGMFASCKVILDKASDTEKPPEDRLTEIITFCQQITAVKAPVASASSEEVN